MNLNLKTLAAGLDDTFEWWGNQDIDIPLVRTKAATTSDLLGACRVHGRDQRNPNRQS